MPHNLVMTVPGRVVILNGASSAGKTTLAEHFRRARASDGDCWLLIGIDDFLPKLPDEWFGGPGHEGPLREVGVRFEPSPNGLEPRVGEVGRLEETETRRRSSSISSASGTGRRARNSTSSDTAPCQCCAPSTA